MVRKLILGLLALAVSAGAADIPAGKVPAGNQQLVRQVTSLPPVDERLKQSHPEDAPWLQDLFEGLTVVDHQGNIQPGVAVSWSSNDNRHWIFTLRKNARWSDGSQVTASDFVNSWQQLAAPGTPERYQNYLLQSGVYNAPEVLSGELPGQVLGITAIDDWHLKITLSRPLAYFPVMTAHPAFFPDKPPAGTPEAPVSRQPRQFNGAWQLNSQQPHSVSLVPNPHYHHAEQTILSKVTYIEISNTQELLQRYSRGAVQISAPLKTPPQLTAKLADQLHRSPRLSAQVLVFDRVNGPTSDVRVRKALSWSIDRQAITTDTLQNKAIAGWRMTPSAAGNFTPPLLSAEQHPPQGRISQAKSLLLAAGYGPSRPLNLTFSYRDTGDEPEVAHAIAAMWQKQLNAQVTLKPQSSGQPRFSGADVTTATVHAEFNHPAAFLNQLTTGHPQNISGFSNAAYDSLILRAERESSEPLRNQDYQQAEHLIAEQVPVAPIFQYVTQRLVAPEVQGYSQDNPLGYSNSRELWIEQQTE